MTADVGMNAIGLDDHRHGVPADVAFDAPLDLAIAGIGRLFLGRDGVDVRRAHRLRNLETGAAQTIVQLFEKQGGLFGLLISENVLEQMLEGRHPFVAVIFISLAVFAVADQSSSVTGKFFVCFHRASLNFNRQQKRIKIN